MTDSERSLSTKAGRWKFLNQPKVEWGYHPDSTVQENPYPEGSALHAYWDMTKMEHDMKRVNRGN